MDTNTARRYLCSLSDYYYYYYSLDELSSDTKKKYLDIMDRALKMSQEREWKQATREYILFVKTSHTTTLGQTTNGYLPSLNVLFTVRSTAL